MSDRLSNLYVSVGPRNLVEIAILTIYGVLRFIGATRGRGLSAGWASSWPACSCWPRSWSPASISRELSKILDYVLATALLSLIVIFQPELRHRLLVLGQYRMLRALTRQQAPIVDKLADAAVIMSAQLHRRADRLAAAHEPGRLHQHRHTAR